MHLETVGPTLETMTRGTTSPMEQFLPRVAVRVLVSEACRARGISTGTAAFRPGSELPYHTHDFSEAITILSGEGQISVAGRCYRVARYDCIHVPRGVAHSVANPAATELVVHWALASKRPARTVVKTSFVTENRGWGDPRRADPEFINRFDRAEVYELAEGAFFRDLFAKRFGSVGICGGYGLFQPGASLPCHVHRFDESITIVKGCAVCYVQGRQYRLSGTDTAFVPEGRPHRFVNQTEEPMAMIWVYAGSEPERTLVDPGYCSGALVWKSAEGSP